MAANRFAKYIVQPEQDQGGGAAPAPAKKPNRFAKYVEPQQPVAPAQPSAAPGMAMVAMGQSAGPRQPAPNPNAQNPIIAAQRASQTQAMGDWAKQQEAERRYRDELAAMNAASPIPFKNTGPDGAIELNQERPDLLATRAFGQAVNTNIGAVNSAIDMGNKLSVAYGTGLDPSVQGALAGMEYYRGEGDAPERLATAVQQSGAAQQIQQLNERGDVVPRIPIPEAQTAGEVGADIAGTLAGYLVGPGKGINATARSISKEVGAVPGLSRTVRGVGGEAVENAAHAYAFGSSTAPEGVDRNMAGLSVATDPLSYVGIEAIRAVPRGLKAATDALTPAAVPTNAGGANLGPTRVPQPAAQPSVAPIPQPTVSNAPRRAAQPAAPGAGQGAPATLQATPTAAPGATPALANSDRKIIGRLLRAGGVPRNDVDRVLSGLVVAHQSSNSARLPLAFFAEEYLPTVLPKQTADDVIQKLRGFGRERYGANDPRDPSRSIVRNTINELRGSQRETLTNQFEGLLGKETLMTKQGKIARDKQGVAEAVYAEEIGRQQRLLAEGAAAPEQVAARDDLLGFMSRKDYFDQIPPEVKLKAADEGKDLWEYVHTNPLEAAHWLQSQLGVLARKGNTIAEAMRMPVVRRLEDSVPGYRGARMEYGDLSGQQAALEFGDDLYRVGGSKFATDQKALEFKKLSRAQKTVAKKSIRDKLLNEFRKAKTGDDQAAVITAMQKDGVLDALETILGPEGKKVADSIRGMVRENERLRAIDLQSGSNTADNLAQMRAAQEAVRSPVNRAVGSIGDESSYARTVFADAVSVALGLPPVWTAGKVGAGVVGKFGAPSKRKLASATRTLYDLPRTAGAAAPEAAPRRAPSRSTPRRQIEAPTQENLDALLKQYDQTPTPALRNKIIAMRKKMNLPARTGDEGFAGVTPMATLAGGAGGYLGAQDLNGDGTVDAGERAAFTALGLGGGYLGGRALSGKGGPKRARNALAPKAAEQPSVQRSYFAGPRGDTYEVTIEATGRGAEVNFRPQGGDYASSGNMSLAEVNDVFRNVEKAIRDDIATNPKPRYVLEGATKQRRDIYEQIAKTRPAPDGYRWEMVSESGRRPYLTLTRSDVPPPASAPKPPQDEFTSARVKKQAEVAGRAMPSVQANAGQALENIQSAKDDLYALMNEDAQLASYQDALKAAKSARTPNIEEIKFWEEKIRTHVPEPKMQQGPSLESRFTSPDTPKPPPVQNGFGSSSLDISEAGRMQTSGAQRMGNLGKPLDPNEPYPTYFYFGEPDFAYYATNGAKEKLVQARRAAKDWNVETVRLEDITGGGQKGIHEGFRDVPSEGGFANEPPVLVRERGRLIIANGNHRLSAAAERGDKTIKAAVIDLDPAESGSSKLPMDEASRMQRAREQGFDVDTPLYHGTAADFEAFDPGKVGSVQYSDWGEGVYLSPSKSDADYYRTEALKRLDPKYNAAFNRLQDAEKNTVWVNGAPQYSKEADDALREFQRIGQELNSAKGGNVLQVYAKLENPYVISYRSTPDPKLAERAKAAGHDGIKVLNGDGSVSEIVVFDPANIRRTDATFDPAQSGSSKLLAGMADNATGYGTAGGAIAGGTFARDTNGDGVVDANERAAGALGGAITGGIAGKAVGAGARRMGKAPPMRNAPRRGPDQAGFSGSKGPPKPPGYGKVRLAPGVEVLPPDRNATKANPRKAGKAYPMPPAESAEIMAARKELRDAKAANTRARNRFVMRDNREELWAEADAREARAMDNLNRLLEEQAMKRQKAGRARDAYHSVKDYVYSERGGLTAGVAATGLTLAGLAGLSLAMGGEKKKNKGVLAPTDPAYFMSNLKNNKDNLAAVQGALVDTGLLADGDDDGNWGKRTGDAIQAWLSRQPDRNPNLPLQDYEVPALLAEAYGGYQDADGKWYYDDGQPIRFPVPNTRGNMADRTLTPAEIRRLKFEERMRKQKAAAQ